MSTANPSANQSADPLDDKKDVKNNPDPKIDQDFPGFPDGPSTEEKVTPETPTEKKSADTDKRDGEKKLDTDKKPATDEAGSDGSASAFSGTEPAIRAAGPGPAAETPVRKRRSDGSANAFERTEGSPLNEVDEDGPDSFY